MNIKQAIPFFDALKLYQEFMVRGLQPSKPFVYNHMWIVPLRDPDGYSLFLESPTKVAEEQNIPNGKTKDLLNK